MDFRRDVLPPFLALTVSLSLHVGLTQLTVHLPDSAEDLDLTPVTVEYLPQSSSERLPAEGDSAAEAAPQPESPPAAEEPSPTPQAATSPIPANETPPPPPPPEPVPPAPEPQALPPTTQPAIAPPGLRELLPRAEDLRPYSEAESSTPDPAGGQAKEVTLTLGDTDVRYRGYLQQVQASIDRSWRWREALLAAGGGGQVLVRFSLGPGGEVEDVGIAESSGSPVLDREAADAIRRAPIPAFPSHWTLQRLNLFAQFGYRLE